MNVMNVIIGSTFALLLACFFMSFKGMNSSGSSNSQELAQLEMRLARLEAALPKPAATTTIVAQPAEPTAEETSAEQAELERVRKELEELRSSHSEIEEQAAATIEEALDTPSPKDDRRSMLIRSALVMARITEYDAENKIAALKIEQIGNVATGEVLGIRRNAGIIGKLTVGILDRDEAVADPIVNSFLGGSVDIQPGDELILPPQ